ncbi:ATP-binding cassette domain-containing protein [Desulfonatronovibrio magnus]|uniref:ATP-binding cassette domain-containing protein n=1 Tax=Desulfonatronovibrio magnus TaxID=698827 RepID=UPI00069642E1|nr:ATP-binding cassette domain-containing protein [Desulfonatronovibrio magnus]
MTEILLNAVLNLFAVQASCLPEDRRETVKKSLELYLRTHLKIWNIDDYASLFQEALALQELSDHSQKIKLAQSISSGIASKMPLLEQYIFLTCFLHPTSPDLDDLEAQSVNKAVADSLSVNRQHADFISLLYSFGPPVTFLPSCLIIKDDSDDLMDGASSLKITRPDFLGSFTCLYLQDVDTIFVSARPGPSITLDSRPLHPDRPQVLSSGAILSDSRGNRIYSGELLALVKNRDQNNQLHKLCFQGRQINFRYPGSQNGLHNFSFDLTDGMLVGVMGVSGAGKSTLLSILNGQLKPDSGQLTVNGINMSLSSRKIEGVMGFVPQDDLLFEELSVFDNLYYSASLCMANLSDNERKATVDNLLEEMQQSEIRDLKVGSPLEKSISGGQRKRLNIALELIREPSVLLVDEPTSGLSSSDSENVMALLKAQAAKGKLVIVVIHQPSSRIFRLLDRLWLLDKGGRPIFDGNPLEAIVHFRSQIFQAGMDEYSCPSCGNVNPEQIFEIIEARKVGMDGLYTEDRLVKPEQWHERYLQHQRSKASNLPPDHKPECNTVEPRLWRPGWLGQAKIFFIRTLKGRLANRQYLLVNVLEPPVLALLAGLISYGAWGADYSFMDNQNISTYFFISIIVALFLGMSVSAQEINRDRKILKREEFLHLNWSAYISAKSVYLLAVAALQMALFVLTGNTLLKIPDMHLSTWLVLFSCAVPACILGLNISSAFKSVVTIYILIPLLLVPQMMLGGAVIPLDDLLHRNAGHRNTPLVADMMPSRWGYEALIVRQYLNNDYISRFMPWRLQERQLRYIIDYHIPEMRGLIDYPLLEVNQDNPDEIRQRLTVLGSEIKVLEQKANLASQVEIKDLEPEVYNAETANKVRTWLQEVSQILRRDLSLIWDKRMAVEEELRQELGEKGLDLLKTQNFNREIADLVKNVKSFEQVRLSGERLVQVAAPIAKMPDSSLGKAHFYSGWKRLGPIEISSYVFNIAVLWIMGLALFMALYYKIFARVVSLRLSG